MAATLLLLGGIFVDPTAEASPVGVEEHHLRIRKLADRTLPYSFGDWLGSDVPTPPSAVKLLHPNVLINRRYQNLRTGESVSLLFVQCADARDLLGHYPPVCYPAHGKTLVSEKLRRWVVGTETIEGTEYRFHSGREHSNRLMVVDNFMVLPSGGYGPDMDALGGAAKDPRLRRFGAAEVQVVTGSDMTDARRLEVFREVVEPVIPLLRGVAKETERETAPASRVGDLSAERAAQ